MTSQIEALETAAGQAGDLMQAAICQIALQGEPNRLTVSALSSSQREILFRTYANQDTNTDWLIDEAIAECLRVIAENDSDEIPEITEEQFASSVVRNV